MSNSLKNIGKDKDGIKLVHPDRSCKDCAKYPCFSGIENMLCDFAKYGCIKFKSK